MKAFYDRKVLQRRGLMQIIFQKCKRATTKAVIGQKSPGKAWNKIAL
jgi:hypothetical protein